jgi:hypothetical protein
MNNHLARAYTIIFGTEPAPELQEWEVAKAVLDKWNVPALGEELAKECIFRIVNNTDFPSQEITAEIVGTAEDKATELFSELEGLDPHMDVIAHLERKYHENKNENSELKNR